jgi:ribonuclease E
MESRRDQFQLLEHFTSAIKDDSARPQIAQLTELGLVELTRKRQGQNIYELFGKKCSSCNGTGQVENQFNHEIFNLKIKNPEEKSSHPNNIEHLDVDVSQLTDKQEKINNQELTNPKDISNENFSNNKKENDIDNLNQLNTKEKNIITVDLSNEEKIVFSQLGINPLIKLGKEYLTSNNFVRLKDNSKEQEKTSSSKKTKVKQIKKISKPKEEIENKIEENENLINTSTKKTNESNEVLLIDKKDENELTDDINNARKKRRRSSASI